MKTHTLSYIIANLLFTFVALLNVVPAYAQDTHQYALYNYRNDGEFNAWLNIDIDSITYSRIDTLGVEHEDVVVQEVWTPDSVYRIPLEAIDSIGFRAPAPVMRDGIFFLRDYHAAHTLAIDSLTLYFDASIPQDSLPSVGQTILCVTSSTPYEEGFGGKVVEIQKRQDEIVITCEEIAIGDIFQRLVLVGKVSSDIESDSEYNTNVRKSSDPWVNYEEHGVYPMNLEEKSMELFDGLFEVTSPHPKLTCTYYVYVNELFYEIYVHADLYHKDLSYKLTLTTGQLKSLKEYGEFFMSLTSDEGIDKWLDKKFNTSLEKFEKEEAEEQKLAKAKLSEKIWKTKKWDIPIIGNGIVNLSLMLSPLFKMRGSLEAQTELKTDAWQSMSFKIKGITLLKNSEYIADFDGSFRQDPIKSAKLDISATGSVTLGFNALLNLNLVHRNVLYAGACGEFGFEVSGKLNFTAIDTEQPNMNWYDRLKDTQLKTCIFAKVHPEIGISPLDILHWNGSKWGLEWNIFDPIEDIYYIMPHFTEPALPKFGHSTWLGKDPLSFYTYPSKNVFIPCKIGMRVTDAEGNMLKESNLNSYLDEQDWMNTPLNINISELPSGLSYKCYPTISFFGMDAFNAGPVHEFAVPLPMVASPSELTLSVGQSAVVEFFGGWDTFAAVISGDDEIASIVTGGSDGPRKITILGKKEGNSELQIEDRRTGEIVKVPIKVTDEDVTTLLLSTASLTLTPGSQGTVDVTSGSGSYDAASNAKSVATVTVEGSKLIIKAVSEGNATITVKDNKTQERAKIEVTVSNTNTPAGLQAVDLGLPSGTLWANMNVGANAPEEYGSYYAWGETEEKDRYDESNYAYYQDGNYVNIGDDIAGTEYDVAHVKWGGDWQMPTLDQIKELLDNTTSTWTTQNGVNGRLFTGTNGNSIFLPVSGFRRDGNLYDAGYRGYYWSSTQDPWYSGYAYALRFSSGYADWGDYYRYDGQGVRPVYSASVVHDLVLSLTEVMVESGKNSTVNITSGSGNYTAKSSNSSVVTVSVDGSNLVVKAEGEGTAIITVTDNQTGKSAEITVTVAKSGNTPAGLEAVDLGLPSGTKWANMNVGAESPEDYGGYYAWGETEEKEVYDWSTYIHCDGSYDTCHDLGSDIAGTEYDVVHVKWRGDWQMPSFDQIKELLDNTTSTWTTQNGVNGRLFTASNGNSIFLPAVGCHFDDFDEFFDSYYWASTQDSWESYYASGLNINLHGTNPYLSLRCHDMNIRPVCVDNVHLILSSTELNLTPGSQDIVDITFGSGSYTAVSSAADVATVTVDGSKLVIKTEVEGTAVITVTDNKTGQSAEIEVTVEAYVPHTPAGLEAVDLGLPSGTLWANMNVGATAPEEYGGYYAWGETEEKNWYNDSTYIHCDGSWDNCHFLGFDIAGTEYDVAHVKWGGDWEMPTFDLINELLSNCTHEWTTVNGVNGQKLTGPNGNSIFLPAAGVGQDGDINFTGPNGYYWSSTLDRETGIRLGAWVLFFSSRGCGVLEYGRERCIGCSVRPVINSNSATNNTPAALEAVDLGLPSGTLWANMNVGAISPTGLGAHFAWGETVEKNDYSKSTYTYYQDGNFDLLGNNIAGTQYDAATANWGPDWQMPSSDQINELLDNTTSTWTKVNGVNGMKFTATNGNSIFLRASGVYWGSSHECSRDIGFYWSSTLDPSYSIESSSLLYFESDFAICDYYSRYDGLSVRPVYSASVVHGLVLSQTEVMIKSGENSTVNITSGSGNYTAKSSNSSVVTVSVDGSNLVVKAEGEGTAIITVTDNQTGKSAEITVTVAKSGNIPEGLEAVDLGLPSGTLWANMNVGAESPEDYGGYYAWGETEEKDWYDESTYAYYQDGNYVNIGDDIAGTEYDVAHVKWGGDWQMPTNEQQDELRNNCTYEWTTVNGVSGGKFTGPNGNSIFVPASGYRRDGDLNYAGNRGYYWSSTQHPWYSNLACGLYFRSGRADWDNYFRFHGQSVRPVLRK